jgi:hypothetical protein
MFFTCALNIEIFGLIPYVSTVYISNSESKSHIIVDNWGMENTKQKVIWYLNIIRLHVQMKWDIEMKIEGSKCCSQMGWSMQKPICKISIRIIKPLKTSWKEVPMDIITALLSWNTCSTRRFTYLRTFIFSPSVVHNYNIKHLVLWQHWDNICKTWWRSIS